MNVLRKCKTYRKTAMVTGATSGIGREIARILCGKGYHVILTGRNERELMRLAYELGKPYATAVSADLSDSGECFELYRFACKYNTEVLVNNAGFGIYGEFLSTSLAEETELIDVNIRAVHILMKLFLRRFAVRDHGYILNVASAAGFMPGPFMSSYYASKSYVVNETAAVYQEIRRRHINVGISMLCPGPVKTDFNRRAGVKGAFSGITPYEAAKAGIEGMFEKKPVIVPTFAIKAAVLLGGAAPVTLSAFVNRFIQSLKKPL